MTAHLRLHEFLPTSRVNGPGRRAVIWTQGCSLGCPGCFNPRTHAHRGGEIVPVESLVERVAVLPDIEGLTVSGGEPLQQLGPLIDFLRRLRRRTTLSVLLFTGYSVSEIERMPRAAELLANLDVLIAGRFDQHRRVARGLVGSLAKEVRFLSSRYAPCDLAAIPEAEILIRPDGTLVLSGIDPWEVRP